MLTWPFFHDQRIPSIPSSRGVDRWASSRSPDSRITSLRTAFSGMIPMTDFRPVRRLLAYSGGTVPDLNRIHYSPPLPNQSRRHLNVLCNWLHGTPGKPVCQYRKSAVHLHRSKPEPRRAGSRQRRPAESENHPANPANNVFDNALTNRKPNELQSASCVKVIRVQQNRTSALRQYRMSPGQLCRELPPLCYQQHHHNKPYLFHNQFSFRSSATRVLFVQCAAI